MVSPFLSKLKEKLTQTEKWNIIGLYWDTNWDLSHTFRWHCRGEHRSSGGFATQNRIAVRRPILFPCGKSANCNAICWRTWCSAQRIKISRLPGASAPILTMAAPTLFYPTSTKLKFEKVQPLRAAPFLRCGIPWNERQTARKNSWRYFLCVVTMVIAAGGSSSSSCCSAAAATATAAAATATAAATPGTTTAAAIAAK